MEMKEEPCQIGGSITEHYAKLAVRARNYPDTTYYFEGNGIKFVINKDSDPLLAHKYINDCYTYSIKTLGPGPLIIDPVEKSKIDLLRAVEEEEMRKKAALEKDSENADRLLSLKLTRSEKFETTDSSGLSDYIKTNEGHFYSKCVVDYAIDLGKLLQIRRKENIEKGISPELTKSDVNEFEHLIRHYSITGYQHGCVVSMLEKYWKYFKKDLFY